MDSTASSSITSSIFIGPSSKKPRMCADQLLNFRTSYGRHLLLTLILVTGLVPLLVLLVQNILMVSKAAKLTQINVETREATESALIIQEFVHELQLERGLSALFISSQRELAVRNNMLRQRMFVDDTLNTLKDSWPQIELQGYAAPTTKWHARETLAKLRHDIDAGHVEVDHLLHNFSQEIEFFMDWMDEIILSTHSKEMWPKVVTFQTLAICAENLGQERARGAIYLSKGQHVGSNYFAVVTNAVISKETLLLAATFSSKVNELVQQEDFLRLQRHLDNYRAVIQTNDTTVLGEDWVSLAWTWMNNMTAFIDMVWQLQREVGEDMKAWTKWSTEKHKTETTRNSILLVVEFLSYPVLVFLSVQLTKQIQKLSNLLRERIMILLREQRRNALMIKEMYPHTVAAQLLKGQVVLPESFESVTICFSGLSDFELLTSQAAGSDVVNFLNRLCEIMDSEAIKHDIYKVETVGDQHLMVSGIPVPNDEQHVFEVANMALDLIDYTKRLTVDFMPHRCIRLSFGICSGSVVAGIVGIKMPRYCLFGDTVNVASRMLSTSVPQKIHLSSSAGSLLSKSNKYKVVPRGSIYVKGKGYVDTFWLAGRINDGLTSPMDLASTSFVHSESAMPME